MADRRLVYTVEIDATQTEAAARKLREALTQITAGAGQVFALDEENGTHHLHTVTSTTPLAFGFTGPYTVKIGQVDVGAAGSATIASAADIVNIGSPGDGIAAGTVSLTSGTNGSIGTSWTGATIALTGTTALTLSTRSQPIDFSA